MRDIGPELLAWHANGVDHAVASVIDIRGSAPRQLGAALAVAADGAALGSVSGGCVEGGVYELARQVLVTGRPARERYGVSADDAFAAGLTCGGELEVFVQPIRPATDQAVSAALRLAGRGEPVALARVVDGALPLLGTGIAVSSSGGTGSTGDSALDARLRSVSAPMLDRGESGLWRPVDRQCAEHSVEVFVESWAAPAQLLVFGATDHAAAVTEIGRFLGYRVTVCDARAIFATRQRFPFAHEVVVDWPHRYLAALHTDPRTVVCVLTHDPKFDVPVLVEALRRPLGYVGALGSRRTCADRLHRLRDAGLREVELARLHSPIGLDLGARSPAETALSVAAEIVAVRRGGSGLALSTTDGSIHHEPASTGLGEKVA